MAAALAKTGAIPVDGLPQQIAQRVDFVVGEIKVHFTSMVDLE